VSWWPAQWSRQDGAGSQPLVSTSSAFMEPEGIYMNPPRDCTLS
jgi:hypothetical protein